VFDDTIGGGLHAGELLLIGGPPGVGKTIASLQMARNVARLGQPAVYVCYEHEEATLALRLLALEAGDGDASEEATQRITQLLLQGARDHVSLLDSMAGDPGLAEALQRLRSYSDNLILVRASGAHTAMEQIDELIFEHQAGGSMPVIFVDYLQKVPVHPEPATEAEKVTRTVEALKDLALTHRVPIVGISAVDAAGMDARRLRLHHLRGSSAIAFEADVVVMMNDKHKAVSKVHLAYDSLGAKRFRDWVVFSIEKNRGGPALIDLEFKKDFSRFRFDPDGGLVSERLVDERMDEEHF
jgi:replicative DNA helicase